MAATQVASGLLTFKHPTLPWLTFVSQGFYLRGHESLREREQVLSSLSSKFIASYLVQEPYLHGSYVWGERRRGEGRR